MKRLKTRHQWTLWQHLKHSLLLILLLLSGLWIIAMPANRYAWMLADPQVQHLPPDPDAGMTAAITLIPLLCSLVLILISRTGLIRTLGLLLGGLTLLYWSIKFIPALV